MHNNNHITPYMNGRHYFKQGWQIITRPVGSAGQDRAYRLCPAYFPLVRKVRGGSARHTIS
jgi:hypothetical protein